VTRIPKSDPTTLCRDDLESGRMRELYQEAVGGKGHALDDEQLSESLTSTLHAKPKGAGWWVFAYGSLLWNPLFPFAEARPAMLRGLHRSFCLYSMASRGTRETPGLVLALDRGGACTGSRTAGRPRAMDELHLLWRREMVVGSYHPNGWACAGDRQSSRWRSPSSTSPQYAGKLPPRNRRGHWDAAARSDRRSTISGARAWRSSRTASSTLSGGPRASPRCGLRRDDASSTEF
jgi:cation transport protein ChaC